MDAERLRRYLEIPLSWIPLGGRLGGILWGPLDRPGHLALILRSPAHPTGQFVSSLPIVCVAHLQGFPHFGFSYWCGRLVAPSKAPGWGLPFWFPASLIAIVTVNRTEEVFRRQGACAPTRPLPLARRLMRGEHF